MTLDSFFYCAPCRLKILVAPLGKLLRKYQVVRFADFDSASLTGATLNPTAFPQGQLMFDFITDWEPQHRYLEDFQHWRKLYAIIAIKDDRYQDNDEAENHEFDILKTKYKFTLLQLKLNLPSDNLPSQEVQKACKTFVLDFSRRLLLALSEMAQGIQALPTVRSPSDFSANTDATTQEPRRPASVGPGVLRRTPSNSSMKLSSRNSLVTSQNSSAENLTEKRGASKGRGRVLKVIGDLNLLCGIIPGAIAAYTQSVEILRLTTDYVWHASALEGVGMSLIILAYLKVEFSIPVIIQSTITSTAYVEPGRSTPRGIDAPTNDFSTDPFPSQSLLDVLPETHTQILNLYKRSLTLLSVEPAPPICVSESILRLAKLLCDVYRVGELNDDVLRANVLGIPVDNSLSANGMYPPRGEIARWAMRAYGPHIEHESISISHRIDILAGLVQIMGIIGFRRRRATLLNELLLICVPHLIQARVIGAAERGLHPHAAIELVQQVSDDHGLVGLMESLVEVYGAIIPKDDKSTFGWSTLRAEVLKACISVCEALPHPAGVARFTSLLFSVSGDSIEKDEQIRLAGNMPRAVATGRKKDLMVEADYWDPFLVENIELTRTTEIELQRSKARREIDKNHNDGPFIYKAREQGSQADTETIQLVQDEEVNVSIILRNKYQFDLEVTSLTLSTQGVAIEMLPSSFILPAYSLHTHTTSFLPREIGRLSIRGCIVKFATCKSREFLLLGNRTRREREAWYDMRGGEMKVKQIGVGLISPSSITKVDSDATETNEESFWPQKTLIAKVLPPQPTLVLEGSSIQDAGIMLLDGEMKEFTIRLRNLSALVVNHLEVAFRDSTQPALEEALSLSAITEEEGAEMEHFLYNRPAFVWKRLDGGTASILGNDRQELCIEAHGKRGLTYGVIRVAYSHIHDATEDLGLQHRQLELDLAVTVNASLELLTCDFLPLRPSPFSFSPEDPITSATRVNNECLIVLEIRNSWIQPLNLTLSVKHPVGPPRLTSYIFQNGQTRRIIASLPRALLSASKLQTPLPRKEKKRQFVVSTSISEMDVAAAREAWWYRQHVLDCLSATWSEMGGSARTGNVEMRGIRLSPQHIQVVKYEVVEATIEIVPATMVDQKFCYELVVKVKNHDDLPLTCCLRLVILPSEDAEPTSRSFCIDGLSQSPTLSVPPNEISTWSTEVTLLARGQFEVGAVIQEQSKDATKTYRRWFAEPCTIKTDLLGQESMSEGRASAETQNAK